MTRQLEIQVMDKASKLGKKPVGKRSGRQGQNSKNFGPSGWSSYLKKQKNCGSSKGSCGGGGDCKQNKFSSREDTVLVLDLLPAQTDTDCSQCKRDFAFGCIYTLHVN